MVVGLIFGMTWKCMNALAKRGRNFEKNIGFSMGKNAFIQVFASIL